MIFISLFCLSAEQKKQKVSEIKAGIDEAETLVLSSPFCWNLSFLCTLGFWYNWSYDIVDSKNGPWGKKLATKCQGCASCKVAWVQVRFEQS